MNTRSYGKSLVLSGLLAVFGAALPAMVGATCTKANVAGTWYAMGVSGDAYLGELSEIDRCKLVVSTSGAIVRSGSSCVYRSARGQSKWNVTGGSMRVFSECGVTGSINVCDSGYCSTIKIQFAQMARDKRTFSMVGYLDIDPDVIFFYKLVKQ